MSESEIEINPCHLISSGAMGQGAEMTSAQRSDFSRDPRPRSGPDLVKASPELHFVSYTYLDAGNDDASERPDYEEVVLFQAPVAGIKILWPKGMKPSEALLAWKEGSI